MVRRSLRSTIATSARMFAASFTPPIDRVYVGRGFSRAASDEPALQRHDWDANQIPVLVALREVCRIAL